MSLKINGVIDGPLSGGIPKAIELLATADIADLSIYGIGSANNGGGSDGQELTLSGTASTGDFIYVASEAPGFTSFFGFAPDFTGNVAAINGDDAIELFRNNMVIDTFGEIDVDGTGQAWEYLDGWASRVPGTDADGAAFNPANWTFSGRNALDGETSNATAEIPFPISGGSSGPVAVPASIPDLQGAGHVSPFVGQLVATTGIVTAVDSNGFYLQDADGDGEIATSDAIFVFTGSAPGVAVGDAANVTGTVSEFTPGGTSTGNLSTTQISSPEITVESSGNALPSAVILGQNGRIVPSENIDDDAFGSFDPETDGVDFFESLEGMRVTAEDLIAVSGTNRFGEIFAVANQGADASGLSARGTLNISPDDLNPEKIQIDEDSGIFNFDFPEVDAGALLGDVTGVVGYSFGNFEIIPTEDFTPGITPSKIAPEVTTLQGASDKLTVVSYNVLNLDPVVEVQENTNGGQSRNVDDDIGNGRFEAIAQQIVTNLNAPDIIGLQEIQDNTGGEIGDGVTAADITLQTLVDAIAAAGGPEYQFIDNTFITDLASGGQPGGNIRTAFLYNPDRVELDAGSVQTIGGQGPGQSFEGARLPLVATFEFNGEDVTIVNNHLSSKGGSSPILGVEQDFAARQEDIDVNGSVDERREQAQAVNDFVDGLLAENAGANIVVLGDMNEFEFVSPLGILAGTVESQNGGASIQPSGASAILTNLTETLPEDERYSFVFQGNSQALDHILVTEGLLEGAQYDIVNVNVEFAETVGRASDHDPVIASLTFAEPDPEIFTLQLLHLADQEAGGQPELSTIPNASAVMNALEAQDVADGTIRLSSGDAIIPGLFFSASEAAFGGAGRADILIQNALGFEAITLGNHEFDLGTAFLSNLILPDLADGYDGALFPYLSANLDFSSDANLAPLEVAGGQEALPNTVTSSIVTEVGGEKVGVIGATTPNLGSISSSGDLVIEPFAFGSVFTPSELEALADLINAEVATLQDQGINKIILQTHFQDLANEESLIPYLSGVDIVIGGGSNALLADETDPLRRFDSADGPYPILGTDADGNPVALVNTDGQYSYVGRLVVDFDENGVIDPDSIDEAISGAFKTDDEGVETLGAEDLVDGDVQAIVDQLHPEIEALEAQVVGFSDVYLNGVRGSVRTEETNMGNLTADANLAEAKKTDPTVLVSLKNGGGIRNPIEGDDAGTPPENGEITVADHLSVLQFNNALTLVTLTGAQLVEVLEHGISLTDADGASAGRFPQVAGVQFSYDPTLEAGSKILSAQVVEEDGTPIFDLVVDGEIVAPDAPIRMVTLSFLANGGDDYPYPDFAEANPEFFDREELLDVTQRTGEASFASNGSEQDALAEYLIENFGSDAMAFNAADTPAEFDERIQNVLFREDTVLEDSQPVRDQTVILDLGDRGKTITVDDSVSDIKLLNKLVEWRPTRELEEDGTVSKVADGSGIAFTDAASGFGVHIAAASGAVDDDVYQRGFKSKQISVWDEEDPDALSAEMLKLFEFATDTEATGIRLAADVETFDDLEFIDIEIDGRWSTDTLRIEGDAADALIDLLTDMDSGTDMFLF